MSYVALLAAAYLIGAIPFAYLSVRAVFHVDVRRHGSGNPGATNAARMWKGRTRQFLAFLVIFVLDAGKGFVACALLPRLFTGLAPWAPAAAAVAAVVGHSFTPFLGLRGGKGVATTVGAFLALEFWATLAAVAVFAVVFLATRIVAAGSLALAVALPIAVVVRGQAHASVTTLAVALGLLVIVRHRSNIQRMLGGVKP